MAVERWQAGEREVVQHPGACALVALTGAGEVVLVQQLREAVRTSLIEIPAGILDPTDENGAACAARELMEETGYRPTADLEPLGAILTSPGFSDERIELFVSRGVVPGPRRSEDEGIDVILMPLSEAVEAVRDGRIIDAKTVAALLLVEARAAKA